MRTMISRSVVGAAVFAFTAGVQAQETPELIARYGDLDAPALVGVVAVAEKDRASAILTRPNPAVHIFDGSHYNAFGRSGGGPFELQTPVDLAWIDSTVIVLDVNQRKLVAFLAAGSAVHSRSLGGDWARRLFIQESDTIVETFVPMSDDRAIVRLRGAVQDTVYRYAVQGRTIRLQAPGAPSLTMSAPFTPQVEWTVLTDGAIAVWDPTVGRIQLLNADASNVGSLEVPDEGWSVGAADREQWIADAIPSEFMGRRGVFEPLRSEAAGTVDFPETFSRALQLLADPSGGVWVRKTTSGSGEVWELLDRTGQRSGMVRLPPGRHVLRVGANGIYASWADDLGVEYVGIYRRPEWAG